MNDPPSSSYEKKPTLINISTSAPKKRRWLPSVAYRYLYLGQTAYLQYIPTLLHFIRPWIWTDWNLYVRMDGSTIFFVCLYDVASRSGTVYSI
jgi:hypothetical protein